MKILKNIQTNIQDELESAFTFRDSVKKTHTIDDYRSKMNGNARAYLFLCHINFPGIQNALKSGVKSVLGGGTLTSVDINEGIKSFTETSINAGGIELGTKDFKYFVKSTSLPESSIEETTTHFCGNQYKLPSVRRTQDWSVSFNVNDDASVIKKFWEWHLLMNNPETGFYGKSSDYMADQKVQLVGANGSIICTYTLYGCWPKSISAVNLDYAANEIAQVDITFSYQYHTITGKSEPTATTMARKMGSSILLDWASNSLK